MITRRVNPVSVIKPIKSYRNRILTRCVSGNDYSDQTFDDVDTVLVKYFTFRSTQYTLAQVYEMDRSPMKSEFNWLCDFSNENNPSSGDVFIEALYENGKTNIASRVMENREGLLKRWLSQTSETNGEKIGLKMHKKNMDISRKMLMKSLEITPETSKSFDEV
tara:strand:+ start:3668 stop:4156 length:489 start_codon:yes stop_codon:yes gene_type:complete